MIKVHIVKIGQHIDSVEIGEANRDLINGYALGQVDCDNGVAMPTSELEQFAKECFEAARKARTRGFIEPEFKDFATFWAERKEKLKDD